MARNYCFTMQNPEGLLTLDDFGDIAKYLIYYYEDAGFYNHNGNLVYEP